MYTRSQKVKLKPTQMVMGLLYTEIRTMSIITRGNLTGYDTHRLLSLPALLLFRSDMDPELVQAQRQWRKAIMLVWRHAAQHKYVVVFALMCRSPRITAFFPAKERGLPGTLHCCYVKS